MNYKHISQITPMTEADLDWWTDRGYKLVLVEWGGHYIRYKFKQLTK